MPITADSQDEEVISTSVCRAAIDSVTGGGEGRGPRGSAATLPTFRSISGALVGQLNAQENADMAPTPAMSAALAASCRDITALRLRWQRIVDGGLASLNTALARAGRPAVVTPSVTETRLRCE